MTVAVIAYVRSSRSAEQAGLTIQRPSALWQNRSCLLFTRPAPARQGAPFPQRQPNAYFFQHSRVERMRGEVHDMAAWPYSRLGGAERAGIAMFHRRIGTLGDNHNPF